jgi:hypothetical protein
MMGVAVFNRDIPVVKTAAPFFGSEAPVWRQTEIPIRVILTDETEFTAL